MTDADDPPSALLASPEGEAIVDRLAEADALTIVVGAGASVESGLPDWGSLVRALLFDVAEDEGLDAEDRAAFVDWTVGRDGLPAAGAVAKAALGDRFLERLGVALYSGATDFAPGPTAHGVAQVRFGHTTPATEIVTTNYDALLEDALQLQLETDALDPGRVRGISGAELQQEGECLVRHVHGILPPSGQPLGEVVLSEADYHLMQHPEAWQERYFAERLQTTLCLFVGTSLSDPNLLRYLYRSEGQADESHVACFVRQQDATLYEKIPASVSRARERTVEARWGAVGVQPAQVDYYSQSAQLLFEVAHRKRLGRAYTPLQQRLSEWDAAMRDTTLNTDTPTFSQRQDYLQSLLAEVVEATRSVLSTHEVDMTPGERLGVSLWVYRPDQEALLNWASSDRAWRDPATLEPVPVSWASPFASVRAFCTGSLVSFSTREQAATRWNHVLGIPLYLEHDDHFGRLPVGVATVASTLPEDDSALGRGLQPVRTEIAPEIAAQLAELLRPEA